MSQFPTMWMTPGARAPGTPSADPNAGLFVRFHMGSILDAVATKEAGGVPKHREVPFVFIAVPGDRTLQIDQPVITDESDPHCHTTRFPELWAKFVSGKDEAVSGTPLTEWALVTRAQAEDLAHYHIRTVEQLAALTDANCQKYMGSLQLREKARVWLEQAERAAPFMALREENQTLKDEQAALRAALESTNAKLAAVMEKDPTSQKPSIKQKATG